MAGEPATPSALDQFTIDLTAYARAGKLDPVLEREAEIRQIVDILLRRRQNNPILVGEPGVGKTAIVEGLALRVATGDVPPTLESVSIRSLDLGLLLAGASVRGEFETRLKAVVKEVESSPGTVVLFIDEAHMLIGNGGQADAANLLKPALARGSFKTIAATTHAEYRRHFEKDPAFARRFQIVEVNEPSEESAVRMLRPLVPLLEQHHGVTVTADAVEAAVRLSSRYMTGRQLPEKAVGVLDTCCARVSTAQHCTPLVITEAQQRVLRIEEEIEALEREKSVDDEAALSAAFDRLAEAEMQFADLEDRWTEEKTLVSELLKHRCAVRAASEDEEQSTASVGLRQCMDQLKATAGEVPLVPAFVDAGVVASVVADQTGIPVGQLHQNELRTILSLPTLLGERILGQSQALATISKQILIARTGVGDPKRPPGLFLLVGPSGVGKTGTCLALADLLYGGERNAIILNMAEYQESHSVSILKGAPPGYVGYGESGVLTEAIRRRPHTVLVLDDIDKAHRDVLAVLSQAFNKGFMEDSQGRTVSFRQSLIFMTSTAGDHVVSKACDGTHAIPELYQLLPQLTDGLGKVFPAALLQGSTIVPYYPLTDASLRHIVELKLERLKTRVQEAHQIELDYHEDVIELISGKTRTAGAGARPIDVVLANAVMPEVSSAIVSALASQRRLREIYLTATTDKQIKCSAH